SDPPPTFPNAPKQPGQSVGSPRRFDARGPAISRAPQINSPRLITVIGGRNAQRRHVKATLVGLSEAQEWGPVLPSGWAPIAAVHHLALDVERWWFHAIVANDPNAWNYFDMNPGGARSVPDSLDVAALYDAECAKSV